MNLKNIFIIGSKGIPGAYGGFETFVDNLTKYHQDHKKLKYHVACKGDTKEEFEYQNAHCFRLKVPKLGAAQAILYDLMALEYCCKYIEKNQIKNPVIYILACRIGPFLSRYKRRIENFQGKLYVNPDGHEWKRAKWPLPVKKYWKFSERLMVKQADLLICDSKVIEEYIQKEYQKYAPKTTFIAYGAENRKSTLSDADPKLVQWYAKNDIKRKEYYLIVGRFVPENNYETIIREFKKCKSKKKLVIITGNDKNMLNYIQKKTDYQSDNGIIFAGTVYDRELLMKIRENAYGYFHGHEVGGTNPSLLEALGSTDLNLVYDVNFNREVARQGALYWSKNENDLARLIDTIESSLEGKISEYSKRARNRIVECYSWQSIADKYEDLFLNGGSL